MSKATVLAGLEAQRRATLQRLGAIEPSVWRRSLRGGMTAAELADWLAAADEAAARGRVRALASTRPDASRIGSREPAGDLSSAEPATLLGRLDRAGARLRRGARALPGLLWRAPVQADDGLRRPLVSLLRLRLLREWVAVSDPALGPPLAPPPQVTRVLPQAALERLPLEVLPRLDVRVGVLRLVLDEVPGQPAERTWGIDFARKHYGPRVEAAPDAVVRTWSGALARLIEGDVAWSDLGAEELRIEGDEELAAACLAAMAARRGAPS